MWGVVSEERFSLGFEEGPRGKALKVQEPEPWHGVRVFSDLEGSGRSVERSPNSEVKAVATEFGG